MGGTNEGKLKLCSILFCILTSNIIILLMKINEVNRTSASITLNMIVLAKMVNDVNIT